MKCTLCDIVNKFTDLDEAIQARSPVITRMPFTRIIELGQFYQWALPMADDNRNPRMNELHEVPDALAWVMITKLD